MKYDKAELLGLLSKTDVYSLGITDSDNENREFNVFDYTWRSEEVMSIFFLTSLIFLLIFNFLYLLVKTFIKNNFR